MNDRLSNFTSTLVDVGKIGLVSVMGYHMKNTEACQGV
jgi:hypothetical protein